MKNFRGILIIALVLILALAFLAGCGKCKDCGDCHGNCDESGCACDDHNTYNPCEDSCNKHSGNVSGCHCHGTCSTADCDCHGSH